MLKHAQRDVVKTYDLHRYEGGKRDALKTLSQVSGRLASRKSLARLTFHLLTDINVVVVDEADEVDIVGHHLDVPVEVIIR